MIETRQKSSPGGPIPAADFRDSYLGTQFSCCTSPLQPTIFTHSGLLLTNSPSVVVHSFPRPPMHRCLSFTAIHSALNPINRKQELNTNKNTPFQVRDLHLKICLEHKSSIISLLQLVEVEVVSTTLYTVKYCRQVVPKVVVWPLQRVKFHVLDLLSLYHFLESLIKMKP